MVVDLKAMLAMSTIDTIDIEIEVEVGVLHSVERSFGEMVTIECNDLHKGRLHTQYSESLYDKGQRYDD